MPEEKQRTKQKHTHTTKFAPRMCGEIALLLSLETRTISRTRFGTFLFDLVQNGESEVSSWKSSPITPLNVHAVYFISCCSFGCKCTIYVITDKDLRYYMYILSSYFLFFVHIQTSRKVRGLRSVIAWIARRAASCRGGNLSKKVHELSSTSVEVFTFPFWFYQEVAGIPGPTDSPTLQSD